MDPWARKGGTLLKRAVIWGLSILLAAGLSSVATFYAISRGQLQLPSGQIPASLRQNKNFARFLVVYHDIRHETIWSNNPNQLMTGAINGMVGTLHDQFSDYLAPKSYSQLNQMLGNSFSGIGIALDVTGQGQFMIVQVFPGTPAAKAGLKPNDQITAINGRPVAGQDSNLVSAEIRGPAGSLVKLTIDRSGKTSTVTIKRAVINVPTVFIRMLPHHVGYMDITEFGYYTGPQVLSSYRKLVKEGARGILLDLRNNPGGALDQCLQASGAFVPAGPVVTLEYKTPQHHRTLDSTGPGTTLPVVVLVNQNTASAAEILAAAIQQRGVGILVGTQTYGKGIVQQLMPLPDGAYLKLTVAKYLTPNGDYIEHKGLTPNVVVTEPANQPLTAALGQDPQLDRADQLLLQKMAGHAYP